MNVPFVLKMNKAVDINGWHETHAHYSSSSIQILSRQLREEMLRNHTSGGDGDIEGCILTTTIATALTAKQKLLQIT